MKQNLMVTAVLLVAMLTPGAAQTETRQLSIDTKTLGIEISPTLSGIFFEDINQSLDGGICAQMIQNNSFQAYNVPDGPASGTSSTQYWTSDPSPSGSSLKEISTTAGASSAGLYVIQEGVLQVLDGGLA